MTVKELLNKLNEFENKDAEIIIDMIDRTYSCFDFHIDDKNDGYVYLVNDEYVK